MANVGPARRVTPEAETLRRNPVAFCRRRGLRLSWSEPYGSTFVSGKKESRVGVALPPSLCSMRIFGGKVGLEGVNNVVSDEAVEERVTEGVGESGESQGNTR
jgi:hypothetical protein